ncbi:MAG: Cupin 2 conserved barrel domain protein [Deinococcus sp.]|nr:Cupin 2 conserved barrel domain protein [Deinococcus sp.]
MSDPLVAHTPTFELRSDRFRILVSGAMTEGRFSVVETLARQGSELPVHVHRDEDELLLVLEGCLCVRVGQDEQRLPAGHTLLLRRGVSHALRLETGTARLLTVFCPAGFEDYLAAVAQPASPVQTPPRAVGPPDVPRLVVAAQQYGLDYFPALPAQEE